ncbi:MAG: recombinase family protein [candidate division Zixibacteria bacterium]|nr:recombinase family protein [candidate division Zixibacteria bacterium]
MTNGERYISTKDQERCGFSIPAQLRILRDYAGKGDLDVVKEYLETESAGKAGRTAFGQMIKHLQSDRAVTEILVEKTDRLYRNFKDLVLIDDLEINIHFVKDNRILGKDAKSSDKFINDIQTAQAHFFLNNLSDEVKKGQRQKARQGMYPGGRVPLGYRRNAHTKGIELDPERAPLISQLFELYADGDKSLSEVHQTARETGLAYRESGRPLARSGIDRLLKEVFYTGRFKWNGTVYQGDHPFIVTQTLYERVQCAFAQRSNGKTASRFFPFSRLMTCQSCGKTITAEVKKCKYTYYHCTGYGGFHKVEYVPESVIDEQFAEVMSSVTIPNEFYNYLNTCLKSELRDLGSSIQSDRMQLELSRDKIINDMKRIIQKNLDGHISDNMLGEMQQELQAKLNAVKFRLANLSAVIPAEYDRAAKTIELSHHAESLYLRAKPDQKRNLIKTLLSNCTLDGRTLCVTYRKPFDLFAEGIKSDEWLGN